MTFTLEDLRQQLTVWEGCDLAKTNRPVFGEGNPHADIVFIGEAPGAKEDETGRPFVGRSGKLLDELIASIGLKRADVYITNIVKYRPPNNRDPKPEEKEACAPWLKMELELIRPKVICPLGKHALQHFCPLLSISNVHGVPQSIDGHVSIFPLYHPAAALHNGALRSSLYDDVRKLKEFLGM